MKTMITLFAIASSLGMSQMATACDSCDAHKEGAKKECPAGCKKKCCADKKKCGADCQKKCCKGKEAKKALKGMDGIKFETQEVVEVELK